MHPILEYIDQQYEAYYEAEKHVGFRRIIKDTRVHACLYFISPTGHRYERSKRNNDMEKWMAVCMYSMKELDIKTLQELSSKVTVIPVIAKADTMTADEKKEFKKAVSTKELGLIRHGNTKLTFLILVSLSAAWGFGSAWDPDLS